MVEHSYSICKVVRLYYFVSKLHAIENFRKYQQQIAGKRIFFLFEVNNFKTVFANLR